MKVILLDTNVVSILFNPMHRLYPACFDATDDYARFISFMTRSELLLWPRANRWGTRRQEQLAEHIGLFTTLLPDEKTCEWWAEVMDESRKVGRLWHRRAE